MSIELLVFLAVAAIALTFLLVRRWSVERSLRGAVDDASAKLKGMAGERSQTLGFREELILSLSAKRGELSRLRRKIVQYDAEITQRAAVDYRIAHIIGEPVKDKSTYRAILTANPVAEKGQALSSALQKAEHMAFIVAESDAAAKRLLLAQYPEKGPLRIQTLMQGER